MTFHTAVVPLLCAAAFAQQWVPIDLAPSARNGMGMVTDTWRNRVVMFAGGGREDTWAFDGAVWTPLPGAQPAPYRTQFACCFDGVRGQIVLFGGHEAANWSSYPTDTWLCDGVVWTQLLTTVAPSARASAGIAFDAARGEVVLFGGGNPFTGLPYNDTWCWSGAWQQRAPATSPPGLVSPQMVYDAARQRVVLVDTWMRVTWEWDGATWAPGLPASFAPRSGAALAYRHDAQRVVMFGGYLGVNQPLLADTWQYDGAAWTPMPTPASPPARMLHAMAWDPITQQCVTFGGRNDANYEGDHADTWAFDGASWSQVPALEQPRDVQGITYDSVRRRIVALVANQSAPAMWEFDGIWHRIATAVPPVGWCHPLAFDPLRNVTWTCTAYDGHATWAWNGAYWQQHVTATSPPPRHFFTLAFDPARGVLVMFGGSDVWQYYNDTWEFDGVDWQQRTTPQSPPGLQRAVMAFHPANNCMVLFGGLTAPGNLPSDHTWQYDGVTWLQYSTPVRPQGRHGGALVLDPTTGDLVLSGGSTTSNSGMPPPRDAWRWNGSTWTATPPQRIYAMPWTCAAADEDNAMLSDGERWWRWPAQPAQQATAAGNACGNPAPLLLAGGRPFLGNPQFRLHLEPTLPNALCALFFDAAASTTPLGNGCTSYLASPQLLHLGTASPTGVASATVSIPRAAFLRGCVAHLQGLAAQPNGPVAGAAASTQRLTVVLGD